MAHVLEPRVRETTLSESTDDFVLEGAMRGSMAFDDVMVTDDTCDYVASHDESFEEGFGTFNGSGELERTEVYRARHTNGTVDQTKVSFAAGAKTLIMTVAAHRVQALGGLGQCYLSLSGGNLILSRRFGGFVSIGGRPELLPASPTVLAPSGVVGGTAYYIFVTKAAGSWALSKVEVGSGVWEYDDYGNRVRVGDHSLRLVGIWYASANNTWGTGATMGASLDNPQSKFAASAAVSGTITAGSSFVECHASTRVLFVTFADRIPTFGVTGNIQAPSADQDIIIDIGLDGVTGQLANSIIKRLPSDFSHLVDYIEDDVKPTVTEGVHYITSIGKISGAVNAGSFLYSKVTILG